MLGRQFLFWSTCWGLLASWYIYRRYFDMKPNICKYQNLLVNVLYGLQFILLYVFIRTRVYFKTICYLLGTFEMLYVLNYCRSSKNHHGWRNVKSSIAAKSLHSMTVVSILTYWEFGFLTVDDHHKIKDVMGRCWLGLSVQLSIKFTQSYWLLRCCPCVKGWS